MNAMLPTNRLVISWAAQALSEIDARQSVYEGWTPQLAGEALVSALKWARHAAGRVGPAGYVGMRFAEAILSDEDHAAMGWGLKEVADPDDLPPMRIMPSPAQISRHEAALQWPAVYLVGEGREGSAKAVGLWAASKAYRRSFSAAVKERGIPRGLAYQLRDKGLSIISQELQRESVAVSV